MAPKTTWPPVLEQQRDADGRDERRQPRVVADRAVGETLDEHADDAADRHGPERDDDGAEDRGGGVEVERVGEVIAGEGAQHVDVAMREVDQAQDPVDHRVAERDEGVDRAERQPVDQLLENSVHASRD